MASNIKVDIVRPTATNGSLSLKGDSGGSATANGITVDSSGNTSITGTFTSKGIDDNASTTALTIDSSGNMTLAEKLIIDPTKGIQFRTTTGGSGTFGSGILDDYEEGTWSPQYADAESGPNQSSGAGGGELALYTKIGRVVHLQLHAVNISTAGLTPGNDFYIRNLPFNSNSTIFYRAPGSVSLAQVTNSGTNLSTELSNGKSAFRISETISGGSFDFITVSEIPNSNNQIQISITYLT